MRLDCECEMARILLNCSGTEQALPQLGRSLLGDQCHGSHDGYLDSLLSSVKYDHMALSKDSS